MQTAVVLGVVVVGIDDCTAVTAQIYHLFFGAGRSLPGLGFRLSRVLEACFMGGSMNEMKCMAFGVDTQILEFCLILPFPSRIGTHPHQPITGEFRSLLSFQSAVTLCSCCVRSVQHLTKQVTTYL